MDSNSRLKKAIGMENPSELASAMRMNTDEVLVHSILPTKKNRIRNLLREWSRSSRKLQVRFVFVSDPAGRTAAVSLE